MYMTQKELADHWKISGRTLEGWRFRSDKGPGWVTIGRAVRYPIEEIKRFERDNFRDIVKHREFDDDDYDCLDARFWPEQRS